MCPPNRSGDLAGRLVTVERPRLTRADHGRGAVGVEGNGPAPPVNRDQMVKPAQQQQIPQAGRTAVLSVLDVVNVARRGWLLTAGEPAVLVAHVNRTTQVSRDGLG